METSYVFEVGKDAKPGQRLLILGWAGGEEAVGVRDTQHPNSLLELSRKTRQQAGILFEGEVTAGQRIEMKQMIQGGASTPLRLIAIPLPARQAAKTKHSVAVSF